MAKQAVKKAGQQSDPKAVVVTSALELAETLGWANVTLVDIAEAAGLKLSELFDVIEDKNDVLVVLGRMIDRRVLEVIGEPDPSISTRDQLFDILMERYEILNDYRSGLVPILESFRFDPKQLVISCPHLARSMSWMLEAAGIDTNGLRGAVKVAGLTGVYIKTLRVWKEDESADLAKVMAALDKDLGRAEQVANTLGF